VPLVQSKIEYARKSQAPFRDAEESAFKSVTDLRLTTGTFPSPHAPEVGAPPSFQVLCYNGQSVGPTIRVRRGTTFHIRVKNDVLNGMTDPHDNDHPPVTSDLNEKPFGLCTTNLHTHGLHVSPASNADNILDVNILPNEQFLFEYTLGADHPSGTFWYHPHKHGSVAYQLSNGLAGALIVEGSPTDNVPDLEDIPEIAAARERILVFQLYNYRTGTDDQNNPVARIDASTIYNVQPDDKSCKAIVLNGELPPGDPPQATAINGVINPSIHIAPGEVQRWRLIHAAWDMDRQLTFVTDQDEPTDDIKFYEIALDGLATGSMVAKSDVHLAPGQRSDVLIQAPALKPGEPERIYHLKQSGKAAAATPHHRVQDPLYLAKVVVRGTRRTMRLPDPQALVKCQPFASIRDDELSTTKRAFQFYGSDNETTYTINDKTFLHQDTIQLPLGTVEEWKVSAVMKNQDSSGHPFHIHVNPFQVVMKEVGSVCTPLNQWRDTLFIMPGETYTIRSRFKDFLGKSVFHCHILDHEDQGMMMPIEFVLPNPPGQAPAVPKKAALNRSSAPAPALALPDTEGRVLDLARLRQKDVVLVFFQGVECFHCARGLRELVGRARGANDPDAVIVAVSSRRIRDADQAFRALGVSPSDKFHLLIDDGHRAFRDFGCYDSGPRHGLFVIDREGVIRARYVGETPFEDSKGVVEVVRQLSRLGRMGPS
jgi:FtsP/CotA-like multicopper oxidase with cupredoxin domain/peroxiredoxin